MLATAPNWAEQVVAIATAVLALSVFGAVAAAVFGAQQVRESRRTRQAQMAAEFFRRWNEESLVEARRLIARFATSEELASAYRRYVAENAPEAYVLYRELDYFEQLAALERSGGIDFELIKWLIGRTLVELGDLEPGAARRPRGGRLSALSRPRHPHAPGARDRKRANRSRMMALARLKAWVRSA
jgi:hypothetical protein